MPDFQGLDGNGVKAVVIKVIGSEVILEQEPRLPAFFLICRRSGSLIVDFNFIERQDLNQRK